MVNCSLEEFLAIMFYVMLEENIAGILENERIETKYCNWTSLCSHMPNMMVFLCVVFLFLCDTISVEHQIKSKIAGMFFDLVCRTLLSFRDS